MRRGIGRGGGRGTRCGGGRVHRQDAIAQRLRREELGVERERRGDFRQRERPVAGINGGAGGGQPRLKSLPPFSCFHALQRCKTSSARAVRRTSIRMVIWRRSSPTRPAATPCD